MKGSLAVLACVFCAARASASRDGHPVEKVIDLLQELGSKVETEGKAEAITFTKFTYWCTNSVKTLSAAIMQEKATVEEETSVISAKESEKATLTQQIAELETAMGKLQASGQEAVAQRAQTASLYSRATGEYTSTIKALEDAITALVDARTNTETESVALAQKRVGTALALVESFTSENQRDELANFAVNASRPYLEVGGDYEAHVDQYDFKSDSVISLLKELKLKFEDEKIASTKAETNSINGFALAKAARDNEFDAAKISKAVKNGELSDVEAALISAQGALQTAQDDLAADSNSLESTQSTCSMKSAEYQERTALRNQETEAIDAAIKILAKVAGVRTEAPSNPVPPTAPVFLEIKPNPSAVAARKVDPKMKAVELLRSQAKLLKSKGLETLAQEISAHLDGPFDAVNNAIEKMIFHLMAEQKDEDEHKSWCDLELSKTNTSMVDKETKLAELQAKIDEEQAMVVSLTTAITEDSEMIASIDMYVAEATEIREAGKAENAEAKKDAQDAQSALANAIAVLESHYKESGMIEKQPYELVQRGIELPEEPSTWDSSYTGVANPENQPDGIISILKQVSADFSKMESDTSVQEETDQKAYEEQMKLHAIEKARRTKDSEMKTEEKARRLSKITSLTATHKHVSDEYEAVVQYLADIQKACVEGDSTYEDRKAARSKEIDALREAQIILKDAFKEQYGITGIKTSFEQKKGKSFLQLRH